jgi:acyl-CoA thioesterase I
MKRVIASFLIGVLIASVMPGWAFAQTIKIVAFGDSTTIGSGQAHISGLSIGVPMSEAYPAKLESALRAKGWNVTVSNQGVPGQTAGAAVYTVDMRVPAGTNLTIVRFGGNDRLAGRSPADIAANLGEIVAKIRAKGSAVILARSWPPKDEAAFAGLAPSVDAYVDWWRGLVANGKPLPQYDSGDGEHINAAATDIVVAHAVPDVERVLTAHGFKPGH